MAQLAWLPASHCTTAAAAAAPQGCKCSSLMQQGRVGTWVVAVLAQAGQLPLAAAAKPASGPSIMRHAGLLVGAPQPEQSRLAAAARARVQRPTRPAPVPDQWLVPEAAAAAPGWALLPCQPGVLERRAANRPRAGPRSRRVCSPSGREGALTPAAAWRRQQGPAPAGAAHAAADVPASPAAAVLAAGCPVHQPSPAARAVSRTAALAAHPAGPGIQPQPPAASVP